jgi:hypothetical protein
MANPIASMEILANRAEGHLHSHIQEVRLLASILEKIEQIAFKGPHSQVDFKFYCYTGEDRNTVDFEVVGYDQWGNPSDLTSDLNAASFIEALKEIVQGIDLEAPQ